MKSKFLAVVLCFGLASCIGSVKRDAPEEIKMPVAVMPAPPADLRECGSNPPMFVFEPVEDKPNYVQLTPDGQRNLKEWIDGKQACIRAWRAWATADDQ